MEYPEIVEIDSVKDEADGIKTIFFKYKLNAKPGQFVMVWIPRMDAKPMGIGYLAGDKFGVTVAERGPFTKKLCEMKPGEKVGIFGPYGNTYNLEVESIALVGGGYGVASLAVLAEHALKEKIGVSFIIGARTKSKLVYIKRLKEIGIIPMIMTDDGSAGERGTAVNALAKLLAGKRIDKVYSCGPEKMLIKVAELCREKKVKCELNTERWFKCGFGICGHCVVDPLGIRLCVEGPTLDRETFLKVTEFGKYERMKSSRKDYFGQ